MTCSNPKSRLKLWAAATACLVVLSTSAPAQISDIEGGVMSRSTIKGDPRAACGHLAFVSNSYSNTVSVIDLDKEVLVRNLPVGRAPVNPTFTRDWRQVYLANVEAGTLTIIDAKTGMVARTIPAGGPHPSGLRFLPDGKRLVISYIGDKTTDPGSLGIIDLATGKLIKSIPVQAQSERFDITPDGKFAYVGNLGSQSISVVDLEKGETVTVIPSPERLPFNVLVSPKGHRAYTANVMGNSIIEIDTRTNTVLKTIRTAPGPNGMTFTPDGDNILMTNIYAGKIQYYNLSAGTVSEGMNVGFLPGFVRLAPDGFKGIFVHPYGRQVTIFDGTTLQPIKNIETGIGPSTVAICGNP